MAKDAEKRKDKLYNVLALLLMAALFGCGVWGVVESRIAKRDYKNSPDVRRVSAVVSSYRTIESKDDDGDVVSEGTFITKIVTKEHFAEKKRQREQR